MTLSNRGFALLAVLWLTVAAAITVGVAMASVRLGLQATTNRIGLVRAAWARDACGAILQAHYDFAHPLRGVDSVDLGGQTWCSALIRDPSAYLNLNAASREQLLALFGSDSLADAILDWRDTDNERREFGAEAATYGLQQRVLPSNAAFQSLAELRFVLGFEEQDLRLAEQLLTTESTSLLNIAEADPRVIATLPGLVESDVPSLREAKARGWKPQTADDILAALPQARRTALEEGAQELRQSIANQPTRLTIEITGAQATSRSRARATILAVPLPERLAIVRRVLW